MAHSLGQKRANNLRVADPLTIIVAGYVVRGAVGGMAWSGLQYVLGLTKAGHRVYFVEDSDDYLSCYDPVRNCFDADPTYGLAFAADAFHTAGIENCWAFFDSHQSRWHGPCAGSIEKILKSADLLVDLSEVNPIRPWFYEIPVRVIIDQDPVFTQIRDLTDEGVRNRVLEHTAFFSFGQNIGREDCLIPDDGIPWQPTRHPVVLESVPFTPGPPQGTYTTIMLWESYPSREYAGVRYGQKSDSFGPYMELPARVGQLLSLAIGGSSAPTDLLRAKGWNVIDPRTPTRLVSTYLDFIRNSKAEFSIAKHGYVVSRSGWFSERSAAYLASGRPVIVQDTGFSRWLPTGAGVLAFNSPDEAIGCIEEVNRRYEFHCASARQIADEYFDSGKVLGRLIEQALQTTGQAPVKSSGAGE